MKKRIFAFDMDGTILNSKDQIMPETIDALKVLRKEGHHTIIVTGRPYEDIMRSISEHKDLFDFFVANNGTYFADGEENFFYDSELDKGILADMIEQGTKNNCFIAIHGSKGAVRSQLREFNGSFEDKDYEEFAKFRNEFISREELEKFAADNRLMQMSLRSDAKTIANLEPYFADKYSDKVDVHIANDVYLDINPLNVDKFKGIQKVMKHAGWKGDVIAFGDSGNDLHMLEGADYSFCMGNGNVKAKEAASEVIGTNDSDAIAEAINRYI